MAARTREARSGAEVTQPSGSAPLSGSSTGDSKVVALAAAAAAVAAAAVAPSAAAVAPSWPLSLLGHALHPSQTLPTRHRTDLSSWTGAWRGARERTAAKEAGGGGAEPVEVEGFLAFAAAAVGGRRGCGGGGGGGGGGSTGADLCSRCCCCCCCCHEEESSPPRWFCCCPERRKAATKRTHASATAPRSRPGREEGGEPRPLPPRLRFQRARQESGLWSLP